MALRTFDICHTVTALKQRGMNFLKAPPRLPSRPPPLRAGAGS